MKGLKPVRLNELREIWFADCGEYACAVVKSLAQMTMDGDIERLREDQSRAATGLSTDSKIVIESLIAFHDRIIVEYRNVEPAYETSREDWRAGVPSQWKVAVGTVVQRILPIPAPELSEAEKNS